MDPFEVLDVRPGCSGEELRAAYERAKKHLGPDSLATYALVDPAEARQMLARIEAAYRALGRSGESSAGEGPLANDREAAVSDDKDDKAAPKVEDAGAATPKAPAEPLREAPAEAAKAEPEVKPAVAAEAEAQKPVRKSEAGLAPDGPVTGDALRRVREAHGLSLKDLEGKTKIGHWHLDNIEKQKYVDLPALVYLRGFLQALARELKLDPIRVSRSYLEEMAKAKSEAKKPG